MGYKETFYKEYVSSHILPRKGEVTKTVLAERAVGWKKTFSRFLPADKSANIIDLGCGYGSIVWWLHRSGFDNAGGIDISEEQIELGKGLGVRNIRQAGIKEFLNDKKEFYEIIIARDVLEHFRKDEIVELLTLAYRSLKTGGAIIIQVPNGESPFGNRIRYGDFTHETAFTISSLSQVLRMAGFTPMRFYPVEPLIGGGMSLARFILWKFVEAFYLFLLFAEIGRGKKIVTQNIIAVAVK